MASSRASALCLLACLASAPAAADGLHLYAVPVRAQRAPDPAAPLHLALRVRHPEQLAARLAGSRVRGDALELLLSASRTLPGAAAGRHLAATFVIDWNEPAVQALHTALVAAHGARPSLDALRAFTAGAIPRKTMERGWDLASRVASDGVGDCTEHAVLLTALARSVGRPARVVVGVLMAVGPDGLAGFGHAWAEIHEQGRWRLVDATPVAELENARHLPFFELEEEGPGYAMALAATTQSVWVREIELLGKR